MPYLSATEWNEFEGEVRQGKETRGRTVKEELGTSVINDEEVDHELEDLHGRYVALPLSVAPNISILVGRPNERNVPRTSFHQQFHSSSNLHRGVA